MKNKIEDLRTHLFEQLERLNNSDLTKEDLDKEIQRANAMSEIGKVIVESAKTQVLALRFSGGKTFKTITEDAEAFTEVKTIERPEAEYSNSGHLSAIKKYGN